MSKTVDLRSDTVTRPGPAMRRAIAEAAVGDDVFGDDPTVIELEKRVASMFGTEASLFVPSGTMGNHIALASITHPGEEVIIERQAHIFFYEVASVAALSGVQMNALDGDAGVITAEQIAPHIRPRESLHEPVTGAIAIENTHNRASGRVFPIDEMKRIRALADERGVKVHLDGARLANAVVASGVDFKEYVACAHTVNMCFSKGLGAPVGSIVASDAATIHKARRKRKQLGGGMRQAGILAAAAIYALDHHIERLAEDHENARRLGERISTIEGLTLVRPPETNIVVFRVDERVHGPVPELLSRLKREGVLGIPFGSSRIRMVTHLDVTREDIERVGDVIHAVFAT